MKCFPVSFFTVFFLFCLTTSTELWSQEESPAASIEAENAIREEVQRYFGYEDLAYRYLTIPYDVSNQVNQQGKAVDIGYPLLALLPIVLLFFTYHNKKRFYAAIVGCTVYLSLCFRHSFLFDIKNQQYNPVDDNRLTSPELMGFEDSMLNPVYSFAGWVSQPITYVLDYFSGQQDHITYPLICGLFVLGLVLIMRSTLLSDLMKVVSLIFLSFFFLWWVLSSAIIWYGFLMIPLGFAFVIYTINWKGAGPKSTSAQLWLKLTFGVTLISWVFLSFTSRVSNVNPPLTPEYPTYGTFIVDPRFLPFSLGMIDQKESLNVLAANLSLAMEKLNSDNGIILQFGSSLAFDIYRNDLRIFEDNSMSYFYGVVEYHRTQAKVTENLKSKGFKYIILDLQLPTLDRTPEKTLVRKYALLTQGFLKNNPNVKLIATDQVVMKNGVRTMGIFGDGSPKVLGSYAVFELL